MTTLVPLVAVANPYKACGMQSFPLLKAREFIDDFWRYFIAIGNCE